MKILRLRYIAAGFLLCCTVLTHSLVAAAQTETGSIGIEGTIPTEAPTVGAGISSPLNGQAFSELPITVTGICPSGLLVKIFKNNVFSGAVQCANGSYSIIIDLFSGRNDLIARVYDALDQAGPDSNLVTVTYTSPAASVGPRVSLTSSYAKRGANPNERLTWPVIISGGRGPYAISVDWGDNTSPDLISQLFPGTFEIHHTYKSSGIYKVVVKATDSSNNTAFLQLVAIANGAISQLQGGGSAAGLTQLTRNITWQAFLVTIPFFFASFWLGRKHELFVLRKQLERREKT